MLGRSVHLVFLQKWQKKSSRVLSVLVVSERDMLCVVLLCREYYIVWRARGNGVLVACLLLHLPLLVLLQ